MFCRHYTLNEVLSALEEWDDTVSQADVYISPPGDGRSSDVDSGDEDTGEVSVDNLPPNQLRSEAEAEVRGFDGTTRRLGPTLLESDATAEQVSRLT